MLSGRFFRKIISRITRRRTHEIDLDEIFLDSSNLPEFDESQLEGRLVQPISKVTINIFAGAFLVIGIIFLSKIWILQIVDGKEHKDQSERNRLQHSLIFADRGVVYDRNGVELIWNTVHADEDFSRRLYYGGDGFSHLLGYLSYPRKDNDGIYYEENFIGVDGVELALDSVIGGSNGLKIVETDAVFAVQSESVIRPPENGTDVILSIDARIQEKLFEFIKERADESHFQGGAGVIMDVVTGEILTLTSFPEYDSGILTEGEQSATIASYQLDNDKPFLNRAVSGLYTPGSIVKPFVAIGVLNEGIIDPLKEIVSTGSLVIPNPYFPDQPSVFKDWKAHGAVDLRHALAVSSNVYFYAVGGGFEEQIGIGIKGIEKYMRLFGFESETGIDVSDESVGTIPTPAWKSATFNGEPWRLGDTYHTAIGQYGFQVTLLQVVRAVAAIANDGALLKPSLFTGMKPEGEQIPISKENFNIVREGMSLAVSEGTASGLNMPNISIAAKTGTAELGSRKEFVNSWVTGFFPAEEPRYAFVVLMERGPRDNFIGGLFVMRQLLEWMAANTPEYLSN